MRKTEVVIVGAGQAGLAMSRALCVRGVDHVVLERGEVGERWRRERWDSLRLLSPNWQSRLPGYHYRGADPHGFMTRSEVVAYLEGYQRSFLPPVETGTAVEAIERLGPGFRVTTDRGSWRAAAVVVATGFCDSPAVPAFAGRLSGDLLQVTTSQYRSPAALPRGGVLVVGASASGVQLAEEIHRTGRPVTLAVGRHVRLPRRYRGRDILAWLDATGILDERAEQMRDLDRARRQPSFQLIGSPEHRTLDLGVLAAAGVRVVGGAADAAGRRVRFRDDLAATTFTADDKLARLLSRIERFVERAGLTAEVAPPEPVPAIRLPRAATELDLRVEGIETVLWATGYRRRYDFLRVPVLDHRGEIRHRGGVTDVPGLYVLGLRFQRRRNSSFLDGVGADAEELAEQIAGAGARAAA